MNLWGVLAALVTLWVGFRLGRAYVAHGAYTRGWMDGYYESEDRYSHLPGDRERVEAQRDNAARGLQ